jgi:hypothetical protein
MLRMEGDDGIGKSSVRAKGKTQMKLQIRLILRSQELCLYMVNKRRRYCHFTNCLLFSIYMFFLFHM